MTQRSDDIVSEEGLNTEPDDSSTDTDSEYDVPGRENNDLYALQRGRCRVSKLPFGGGLYAPVAVPRCVRKPMTDTNSMLVLRIVKDMHNATPKMPWREFATWLNVLGNADEF